MSTGMSRRLLGPVRAIACTFKPCSGTTRGFGPCHPAPTIDLLLLIHGDRIDPGLIAQHMLQAAFLPCCTLAILRPEPTFVSRVF